MTNKESKKNLIDIVKMETGLDSFSMFSYGSVVYKNKEASDFDYIIVCDTEREQCSIKSDKIEKTIEITFYTKERFKELLELNEIAILECVYLSENETIKEMSEDIKSLFTNFKVNPENLRPSISQKSSNSYVKAKKKLLIKKDFDVEVSMKSLWHSIRMVMFAIQIVKNNKIVNYQEANDLYKEIWADYSTISQYETLEDFWSFIHKKYKPKQNSVLSELRTLCPKN